MSSSVLRSLHALQQAEQELHQHQAALAAARKALQDMAAAAKEHARSVILLIYTRTLWPNDNSPSYNSIAAAAQKQVEAVILHKNYQEPV